MHSVGANALRARDERPGSVERCADQRSPDCIITSSGSPAALIATPATKAKDGAILKCGVFQKLTFRGLVNLPVMRTSIEMIPMVPKAF